MRMEIKEEELSENHKKHIRRKQDTLLQFRTSIHHRNERIRPYHKNNIFTREKTDNIYVEDHKLNKTKLQNFRKRNVGHHSDSQRMEKISRRDTKKSQDYY